MKVLISDPSNEYAEKLRKKLLEAGIDSERCRTGRDLQLRIYRDEVDAVILDMGTYDHSAFEVLKYIKANSSSVRVILTAEFREDEGESSVEAWRKMGVEEVLVKPYDENRVVGILERKSRLEAWKDICGVKMDVHEDEFSAKDEEFARVRIDEFYQEGCAIFDHYIRLPSGKFIRLIRKGEKLDADRVDHYRKDKNVEYLYFKLQDRASYINYINQFIIEKFPGDQLTTEKKIRLVKALAENFIDELYGTGPTQELMNEGRKLCQSMYDLIWKDKRFAQVMRNFEDYDPPRQSQIFLTSLFSLVICRELDWATPRAAGLAALGALLHDIGKVRLSEELKSVPFEQMGDEQKTSFMTHPVLAYEFLKDYPEVPYQIVQIIYQHHETMDGHGYPNGLSGTRIYPMAKIVGLADEFASVLVDKKLTPLYGLQEFVKDPLFVQRFDVSMIKCLFKGFMTNQLPPKPGKIV